MLRRRGLLGLFAAAPVIIAADRLMPVRSPRLVSRPLFVFGDAIYHGVVVREAPLLQWQAITRLTQATLSQFPPLFFQAA